MSTPGERRSVVRFAWVAALFVVLTCYFGLMHFDLDEFAAVKQPYEMLGGDYTLGYLRAHEYAHALDCAARAYRFFWQYRPLHSPLIAERDKGLFATEERRFGYVKPAQPDSMTLAVYRKRLIVPEPDRFYREGSGTPLLTEVAAIPSLALVRLVTARGPDLLDYQFGWRFHPIFLLARLHTVLAGLLCVALVFTILRREVDGDTAVLGAALLAALPPALLFFPNLHHDYLLAPLVLLASYLFVRQRYVIGGVAFGLAMGAKNTAVFVVPVALLFAVLEAVRVRRAEGPVAARADLRRRLMGFATFGLVSLVSLAPFANPVSEFQEILTPITHRAFDPRGENVAQFALTSPAGSETAPAAAIRIVTTVVNYTMPMLFVALALPVLWSLARTPMARYAYCFLLTIFPSSLVFGYGLKYRSLMFLPFFALLAPHVMGRRAMMGLLVVLLVIDVVYVLDPLTARGLG
jgi:hypothetical protein